MGLTGVQHNGYFRSVWKASASKLERSEKELDNRAEEQRALKIELGARISNPLRISPVSSILSSSCTLRVWTLHQRRHQATMINGLKASAQKWCLPLGLLSEGLLSPSYQHFCKPLVLDPTFGKPLTRPLER